MTVPFAHFMLKDVTIKGSVVYDDEDFSEVMQMVREGKAQISCLRIELINIQADSRVSKIWSRQG